MTAFASSEIDVDNLTINCELRSLNHRYCDINLKLPVRFRFAETQLYAVLSSQLNRGKIECSFSYKIHTKQESICINQDAVKALLHATSAIEEHMHTQQSFTALDVLGFPGIQQEPEINKQAIQLSMNKLLENTVKNLIIARKKEGSQLAILIEERCKKIQVLVDLANKQLPETLERIHVKIKTQILDLIKEADNDRLEQEMVFLAQKLDVTEELDRIDTHILEVLNNLKKDEPIGRRLDFIMQELNREANTLGSKSADKKMTQISIDLKVLIEQMREQIQNIE